MDNLDESFLNYMVAKIPKAKGRSLTGEFEVSAEVPSINEVKSSHILKAYGKTEEDAFYNLEKEIKAYLKKNHPLING